MSGENSTPSSNTQSLSPQSLADAISPYLLLRSQDPVRWLPWSPQVSEQAQAQAKLIYVHVGRAGDGHSLAQGDECFRDPTIAALLNDNFICVASDANDEPLLERTLARASQVLRGRTGSTYSALLLPNGRLFFVTGFLAQADGEHGPGFASLLSRVLELKKSNQDSLTNQADELQARIEQTFGASNPAPVSRDWLRFAERALTQHFDEAFGGFGNAPKLPPFDALRLLLRSCAENKDSAALRMLTTTLDAMSSGALRDHISGGFFGATLDRLWLQPNFEKSLSDNAQLIDLYTAAFQLTLHTPYLDVARETAAFVLTEMRTPAGAFLSRLLSPLQSEPGSYYLWTRAQVKKALGEPAATRFSVFFGIEEDGAWRGKSMPSARRSVERVARDLGCAAAEVATSVAEGRELLRARRAERPPLQLDDRVFLHENALLISALCQLARVTGEGHYAQAALQAAQTFFHPEQPLPRARVLRGSDAAYEPSAADLSLWCNALLDLYESTHEADYLQSAEQCSVALDAGHSCFGIALPADGWDARVPNQAASAVRALARLAAHTAQPSYRSRAAAISGSQAHLVRRDAAAHSALIEASQWLLEPALAVLFAKDLDEETSEQLRGEISTHYLPSCIFAVTPPDAAAAVVLVDAAHPDVFADNLEQARKEQLRRRVAELSSAALAGRASAEGTARYLERHQVEKRRSCDGLQLSAAGLGGYRIGLDKAAHAEAVQAAFALGINWVDSSPAFAWGDSERVIGQSVRKLVDEGKLARDEIVLVSKLGVALGSDTDLLKQIMRDGAAPLQHAALLQAEAGAAQVQPDSDLSHGVFCLDPAFLREQLRASLQRLQVEHLDICLLQSPEHLLQAGFSRDEVDAALRAAFSFLEEAVAQGLVGRYGVLSNTLQAQAAQLSDNAASRLALDVSTLLNAAQAVAAQNHHFRVLALPFNLIEHHAASVRAADATGQARSVLEQAADAGLFVIGCRPLSAMTDGTVLRLVDTPAATDGAQAKDFAAARYKVASLEAEFETTFAAQLRLARRAGPGAILPLSGPLGQTLSAIKTLQQFEMVEATLLTPRLRTLLSQLDRAFAGPGEGAWQKFKNRYIQAVGGYLACLREQVSEAQSGLLAALAEQLPQQSVFSATFSAPQALERYNRLPWAEKALRPLFFVDGLGAILVGMRNVGQVEVVGRILRDK